MNHDAVLVADIGGTNSRFALALEGVLTAPFALANDGVPDLETALAAFLGQLDIRPRRAVLAVAAPVSGRVIRLTNRDWTIEADALERRFGFDGVTLLNDFAAQAHALRLLPETGRARIGGAPLRAGATRAVVGPGTGLGVAALVVAEGRTVAVASEAGHMELAPSNAREEAVYAVLRARFGRLSGEMAVSGPGLSALDAALAAVDGGSAALRPARAVTEAARAGEPRAAEAAGLFLDALARFTGDVALAFLARGGVYITGGVAGHLHGLVDAARFRVQFEAKAPHGALMREIGTAFVTEAQPGLLGCAAYDLYRDQ